jgi:poly-beta-1,6-N-acetyl-D-glucosamine biosynthesis protein PgaD
MKRLIIIISSIFGWAFLIYLIVPIITSLIWIFWSIFLYRKLFLPKEIYGTVKTFFILLIVSFVYFLILRIWAFYNYKKYYRYNKRKVLPINYKFERLGFKKIELDEENINELVQDSC